jgi:isopentenyldiphosphate isomerase
MSKRGLVVAANGKIEPGSNIDVMHQLGIPHIHACLLLTRTNMRTKVMEALLQKRSSRKQQYPGYWCFSAAGHCDFRDYIHSLRNDNSADLEGIQREAKEELGINIVQLENPDILPYIIDSSGKDIDVSDRLFYRLKNGLATKYDSEINPYCEKPILTVAQLHLYDNNVRIAAGEEIDGAGWFPLRNMPEMQLTPWLEYFLNKTDFAKTGETWGEHNYRQAKQESPITKSTLKGICAAD